VRTLRLLALAGSLLITLVPTAFADVDPNPGSSGVGIGVTTSGGAGFSRAGADGRTCRWTTAEPEPFKSIWAKVPPPHGEAATSGQWARWDCSDGAAGIAWFPNNRPAVGAAVLAREAYRYLPLPAPRIQTSPAANRDQLVNLRTWLWIDPGTWGTRSATASVPGLSGTVVATPVSVTWVMGDGGRVVCRGPGTPYDPTRPEAGQRPSCSYTYRRGSAGEPAGRFVVRATTTWRITWVATGAPGGGSLSPLARWSQAALRVAEVQALNS